jgi:CheY-like chemotaxis protein
MDDEPLIRDITSEMLEHFGFNVVTCTNGEEACRQYKSAKDAGSPFHVVLLDIIIDEGMGGVEAGKKILEYDPDAKLIAYSGYSNQPVMAEPLTYGFKLSVPKPFSIGKLLDAIEVVTSN